MTATLEPTAPSTARSSIVTTFFAVLKRATELNASDVHVSAGGPFRLRIRGQMASVTGMPNLEPEDTAKIAAEILTAAKKATPATMPAVVAGLRDIDCSYSQPGLGCKPPPARARRAWTANGES